VIKGFKLIDSLLAQMGGGASLWAVNDIRFVSVGWPLRMTLERTWKRVRLSFESIASFPAHDEPEILGYWRARAAESVPIGTLYEIEESTYKNEFANSTAAMDAPLTHYLIAGHDLCVEVLSANPPIVGNAD